LRARIGNEASVVALISLQIGVQSHERFATRHAIIIGGGASGVLLAYQLLHDRASGFVSR